MYAIKNLTVRGPYRGISGHDHHVREFVRELSQRGVQIELLDLADWSPDKLPRKKQEMWFRYPESTGRRQGGTSFLHAPSSTNCQG